MLSLVLFLTHQLYTDDDTSASIFGSSSCCSDESLASLITVIAENSNAVHTRLYVLSQHAVSRLLVQCSEYLSVSLVNLEVLRIKLQSRIARLCRLFH